MPFYRGLRAAYPAAKITLLCVPPLPQFEFPELFDEIVALSPQERKSLRGLWRAGRRLRERNFDLGITLPASWSSAFFLWAAGCRRRIGFAEGGASLLLTTALPWLGVRSGKHKAELYLELLRWMTAREAPSDPPAVEIAAREKTIVVAPGASIPLREWPGYFELLSALRLDHPDYRICVVGSDREAGWHERLRGIGDANIEDLVGKTTLPELLTLCARATLVVANDSGVAHLAASLARTPLVVLFGPGDPRYVRPRGEYVEVVRDSQLPCSPCESATCRAPFGYQRCLKNISVDSVREPIRRFIRTTVANFPNGPL